MEPRPGEREAVELELVALIGLENSPRGPPRCRFSFGKKSRSALYIMTAKTKAKSVRIIGLHIVPDQIFDNRRCFADVIGGGPRLGDHGVECPQNHPGVE